MICALLDYRINQERRYAAFQTVLAALGASGFFFLGLIFLWVGESSWSKEVLLFRHRFTNEVIANQASDSFFGYEETRTVKVKSLALGLRKITYIDTATIANKFWVPIPPSNQSSVGIK